MTEWTQPKFRCKCGGWEGWDLAPNWHDKTCPFPLDVNVDESREEYQTWRAKFVPEQFDEMKEVDAVREERIRRGFITW
jgi:hypothetical protein